MKKAYTILIALMLFPAFLCSSQDADSGSVDPWIGCQAFFSYYPNDSIKAFVSTYPYSFVDQSYGNVVEWKWDFGDGTTSFERNPLHFYDTAGDSVLVCLAIKTADNCESRYCTRFVVGQPVFPPPPPPPPPPPSCHTDFTVSVIKTNPPAYQFIPDTLDVMVTYYWDFGDGMYSDEISPVHQYEFDGRYAVNLNMIYPDGCSAFKFDTLLAEGYSNECKALWEAYDEAMTYYVDPSDTNHAFWNSVHVYHFYDRSKGNVVQWNWNFGDGSTSTEPNPLHIYNENGIYPVCLDIVTNDSCSSTYCDTLYLGIAPDCSLTGTVKDYTGLDGCGLIIELDNGERLEPAEIVPNFLLKEGQRVQFSYTELKDRASVCMVGKIVRIDCITEILSDTCQASFTYSAIPWISSWPPIYQFEDQSSGSLREIVWDLGDGTITSEFAPTHRYKYSGYYNICLTIYSFDGCSDSYCETAYFEGINPQQGLCENFIRLTTDVILNGQNCNGSATASLVDNYGNGVFAADYLWSTGETGPAIYNLCSGWTYSVTITDSAGCAVSGSFYFEGGNEYPDSLFGYWNYQQNNMDFVFNLPLYSDSLYCRWNFGDGSTADGSSVNHTYESDDVQTVIFEVFDLKGNLLYGQEIAVTPGNATGVKEPIGASPEIYPVPANDVLYLRLPSAMSKLENIEVLSGGGQVLLVTKGAKQGENLFQVDVSSLPAGFYMGRLLYNNGSRQSFRFVK
jgi:PKD repeat protein